MKKYIAIGAAIAALFVIAPGVVGFWVEGNINQVNALAVEPINNLPLYKAMGYRLENRLERGWFSSKLVSEFSIETDKVIGPSEAEIDLPETLTIKTTSTLHHGPIFWQSPFGFGLALVKDYEFDLSGLGEKFAEEMSEEDRAEFDNFVEALEFSGHTTIRFDGVWEGTGRLVAGSFTKEDVEFAWGEWSFDVLFDPHSGETTFDGVIGTITAAEQGEGQAIFGPITLSGDMVMHTNGYMTGRINYGIDAMNVEKGGITIFDMQNIEVASVSAFSDDQQFMNQSFNVSLEKLVSPEVSVENIVLRGRIDDWPMSVMEDYARFLELAMQQDRNSDPASQSQLLEAMRRIGEKIFASGTHLVIEELGATFAGGRSSMTLDFTVNYEGPVNEQAALPIIIASTGESRIVLNKAHAGFLAATGQEQQFMQLLQAGMIQDGEAAYSTTVTLKDGIVSLNGQPMVDLKAVMAQQPQ